MASKKMTLTIVVCLTAAYLTTALTLLLPFSQAHIDPLADPANPRQLYSYFNGDAGTDISLDGQISRGTSSTTEWDRSFVRNITLSDFGSPASTRFCYLFLMNDDDYLYAGLVYPSSSSSANDYVTLYFDEGEGATAGYDGPHDDLLTGGNENFVKLGGSTSLSRRYWDGYYNAAAGGWTNDGGDGSTDKGSLDNFDFAVSVEGSYYNREVRIPLDPKDDSVSESDLNVIGTDEIGLFIEVYFHNEGKSYYWDMTSGSPTNVSSYADLQLGMPAKDRTFYATYARSGAPVVDGDITGDFSWADCYSRDISLCNFQGDSIPATVFIMQDTSSYDLHFGLVVRDAVPAAGDAMRIYFEQGGSGDGSRNGVLDGSMPNFEQYCELSAGGTHTDGRVDTTTDPATWKSDSGTDDVDGKGDASYINEPGTQNDRYEFELLVPYNPLSPSLVDADYDLALGGAALPGMLLRYYDADRPAGKREFWWDRTVNLDQVKTRENAGGVFVAPAWILLQMGAPWMKLVSPVDGSTVKGNDCLFRVALDDEDPGVNDVVFAGFQIAGQTTWTSLIQAPGTLYWETAWDTTSLPDGTYDITVAARDNDGIVLRRSISVTVANGAIGGAPPSAVAIITPSSGATLSGNAPVAAGAAGASSMGAYIDDRLACMMAWNAAASRWECALDTTVFRDGPHTLKVTAFNSAGSGSDARPCTIDNWGLSSVEVLEPRQGATLTNSGDITLRVDFSNDSSGERMEVFVDGGLLTTVYAESDLGGGNRGYVAALDPRPLGDGEHRLRAVVSDPDGNSASDTVSFYVRTCPVLTVQSPAEGATVGGTFTIRALASDTEGISSVEYRVDGSGAWVALSAAGAGAYAGAWNTGGLTDGDHRLEVRATDAAAPATTRVYRTAEVGVKVDNTAPDAPVLQDPAAGGFICGVHAIKATARDQYGIRGVSLRFALPGGAWLDAPDIPLDASGGCYAYALDTTRCKDGPATVTVTATDAAGNVRSSQHAFNIDNNAPVLTVNRPRTGDVVFGTMALDGSMADAFPGSFSYSIDGGSWNDFTPAGGHDTRTLRDGPHEVAVRALDQAGHFTVERRSVVVDNLPPAAPELLWPPAGGFVEGRTPIRVAASDIAGVSLVCATISQEGRAALSLGRLVPNLATGCCEAELDTRLLADGEATINLTATDLAGHAVSSETTFRVDNAASSLLILFPMEGECMGGTCELLVEARDAHPGSIEYRVDGQGWVDIGQPLDTTRLADGRHEISARALDAAGHETLATVSVLVDNNDPAVLLVRPYSGEFAQGYLAVKARADDAVGLRSVGLEVFRSGNGTPVRVEGTVMMLDPASGLFTSGLDTTGLPDGRYFANVTATDLAGRSVSTPAVEFNVDNHAPQVLAVSPRGGEVVSGTVSVEALVSDESGLFLEPALYSTDLRTWRGLDEPWNTTGSPDGPASVVVRATDAAGHVTESSVGVIVDNSEPRVRFAGPVRPTFVEGTIEIAIEASDAAGVQSVRLTVDGSGTALGRDGDLYLAGLDTGRLADGAHALVAEVTDLAGRKRTAEIKICVDNTPPSLRVQSPRAHGFVCGTVDVAAWASDLFLERTEYRVDGLDWTNASEPLDTTLLPAGSHLLGVRAVDGIGHETVSELPFTVDNRDPKAAVISPPDDVHIAGEVVVRLSASDDLEVESVTLRAANRTWPAALDRSTGQWEALVNTRNLPEGENDLEVGVTDVSGRTSLATRRLMVDNSGPSISLLTGRELSGRSDISFRIEDRSAIGTYRYRLDGGEWRELLADRDRGIFKFDWATGIQDNGVHRLDIRAADSLGNVNEESFRVRVDNQDHSWAVVLGLVVIAAAMGAMVFLRRRGRPEPETVPGEPSVASSLPDIPAKGAPEKRGIDSESAEGEHGAGETEPAQRRH
ncbi:MAG: hypothetical protein FJ149_05665 [Euryarchaeota archaeon]|nr:hypothetical protein [Euryarchaeota archaeon]